MNNRYKIIKYTTFDTPDSLGLEMQFDALADAIDVNKLVFDIYFETWSSPIKNIDRCDKTVTVYFDDCEARSEFMHKYIEYKGACCFRVPDDNVYLRFNKEDSFTCTIDDINEEVRKMLMNMPTPNAIKPETDDLKLVLNSIYGVRSINVSTAGYNPNSISKDTLRKMHKVTKNSIYGVTLGEPIKPYDLPKKDDFKDLSLAMHKVQFNEKKGVTTIVWEDGEITMAKCSANDIFDRKIGVLVCLAKRFFNNNTQFNTWLNEVTEEPEEEMKSIIDYIVEDMAILKDAVNKYQPKHAK